MLVVRNVITRSSIDARDATTMDAMHASGIFSIEQEREESRNGVRLGARGPGRARRRRALKRDSLPALTRLVESQHSRTESACVFRHP